MNSFWQYYSGEKEAPFPTIFIGGNHEAFNYLWELYYGGWAAPNIYFLGLAGVVKFGNVRIGWLSGIYKPQDYSLGHFERPPYNESDIKSVYLCVNTMFTSSCKCKNLLIFSSHMIGPLVSLTMATGETLFVTNLILRMRFY